MSSSSLSLVTVVPQIQFNDRVVDFPVVCRDGYAQCKTVQQTVEISQVQFLAWLSTRPLLCNGWVVVAQRLARQWIHVLRQFAAFSRISRSPREGGLSDPEVDLVLFSSSQRRTMKKCAQ